MNIEQKNKFDQVANIHTQGCKLYVIIIIIKKKKEKKGNIVHVQFYGINQFKLKKDIKEAKAAKLNKKFRFFQVFLKKKKKEKRDQIIIT